MLAVLVVLFIGKQKQLNICFYAWSAFLQKKLFDFIYTILNFSILLNFIVKIILNFNFILKLSYKY